MQMQQQQQAAFSAGAQQGMVVMPTQQVNLPARFINGYIPLINGIKLATHGSWV